MPNFFESIKSKAYILSWLLKFYLEFHHSFTSLIALMSLGLDVLENKVKNVDTSLS